MGAGLAAQRGWPKREPNSPRNAETTPLAPSRDPTPRHADSSGIRIVGAFDETQPLEAAEGWDHQTSSGMQCLVPVERQSMRECEEGDGTDLNVVRRRARNKRGSSIAYDLGIISTEEEIRRRFSFRPLKGFNLAGLGEKMKSGVASRVGTPWALLYFLLPISRQLRTYNSGKLARDLTVGATMATMMIPQGLAFATVAGIPLLYGLYIVWIPPLLYALFGASVHVSYGPFALMALFMSDALGKRGYKPCHGLCAEIDGETQEYLEACTIITFMVGVWYFILSLLKLGEPLAILLADPVIDGFVTASAILVADAQVFMFLQTESTGGSGSSVIATLSQAWASRASINWASTAAGVGSIVLYLMFRRCNSHLKSVGITGFFLPEALLVVIVFTCLSWAVDLHGTYGVDIVGDIPPGLPAPSLPRLGKLTSFKEVENMAEVALVAAIMSFILTHSIAKSLSGATEIKATPQLFAFGMANFVGSMFCSLPGAASLSRAAIIDALNARTVVHNVFTFILMTLVLLYFSPLLKFLPTSVLAGTIYAVIYKFFDFREPFRLYRVGYADLMMWVATFAATLGLSVKQGMVVGMAVSAFTLIQRSSTPPIITMGRLPGTELYRDIRSYPAAERVPGVEVMRFGAPLTFANKDLFRGAVIKLVDKSDSERRLAEKHGLPQKPPLQYVVLDSGSIHDVDSSSLKMLEALVALLLDRQPPLEIFLAPVCDALMLQIHKSPMLSATLGRRYFLGIAPAVKHASEEVAGGMLVAPPQVYHKVMSDLSLGSVDDAPVNDI